MKIIYGSGSGNTEMVCRKVAEVLEVRGHKVELFNVKVCGPQDVGRADLYIWGSPTYGHGQIESFMGRFMRGCGEWELKGVRCAVIGLGDMKYDSDYLIESAVILEEFLVEKGAELVCKSLKIAKSPVPRLETNVKKWAEEISGLC